MTAIALLLALAMNGDAPRSPELARLAREAAEAREANRTDDAIRLYRRILQSDPDWKEGLWFLGTLQYDQEHFAEARDIMRRFVADEPDAGPGWVILGLSEYRTREYARALPHLQHGLALGLQDRDEMRHSAWYFTAALLTRFERFDQSMDMLLNSRATGPLTPAFADALGLAALHMPLLPAEIPADRREMVRMAGQAAAAYAAHDDQIATERLRELVARYPREPGVHFLYGDLLIKQRPEEGMAELQRELEVSPDHVAARIEIASEYVREEKPDTAIPFAREAVELEPASSDAHLALGEALVANGDLRGGIHEMETSRDVAPRAAKVRWALAKAYFSAGRKADGDREAAEMQRLRAEERKNEGSR